MRSFKDHGVVGALVKYRIMHWSWPEELDQISTS